NGPLIDAVRAAVSDVGDPNALGVRLVLDGLDEPGSGRAARLLDEARALARTWPRSQVLATTRPGLLGRLAEAIQQRPLGDREAAALVERVGGHASLVRDESESVRTMLRLPLFALIAALYWQRPRKLPRS